MKKYLLRLAILALLVAAVFAVLRFTPVGRLLDLKALAANRDALLEAVHGHYLLSVLAYIALYLVVVALSIPGATVLTLLGGFLFGVLPVVVFINIGATIGATLVFLAARYFLGEMIQQRYGDRLARFNEEMEANGGNYLLTLRLVPLFPFWMINLFAGVTRVRPLIFIWTTAVGIIPGSFVYAYAGFAFADLGRGGGIPKSLVLAFLLLAALSLIPVVIKKIRTRRSGAG